MSPAVRNITKMILDLAVTKGCDGVSHFNACLAVACFPLMQYQAGSPDDDDETLKPVRAQMTTGGRPAPCCPAPRTKRTLWPPFVALQVEPDNVQVSRLLTQQGDGRSVASC